MNVNRHTAVCFLFIGFCFFVWAYSTGAKRQDDFASQLEGQQKNVNQDHYFQSVDFYQLVEGKKSFYLRATELTLNDTIQKNIFINPQGMSFDKQNQKIFYNAKKGIHYAEPERLVLNDEVLLKSATAKVESQQAEYIFESMVFYAKGNVRSEAESTNTPEKVFVTANEMEYYMDEKKLFYRENVDGRIERTQVYQPNIFFKAQEVVFHQNHSRIDMKQNVYINRLDLKAWSRNGQIFLENLDKKLKYFVLTDDVKVVEKVNVYQGRKKTSFFERRAFSEKLEGFSSQSLIVLTGNPKVIQQSDVIKGNRIILREDNQVIEVDDANTHFSL